MDYLHVVVAVISDQRRRVLLALRPQHKHQGGLWEFPGGKVEPGETSRMALARELYEELGVVVGAVRPLIQVPHRYSDRAVLLDVWWVEDYRGEPHGREGQPLAWVALDEIGPDQLPAANRAILTAAKLPAHYVITPDPEEPDHFYRRLERVLRAGERLVQLRAKGVDEVTYKNLSVNILRLCRKFGAKLLLNAPAQWVEELGADGVHLTSTCLMALRTRPLGAGYWVAASCHSPAELRRAAAIGVDFAVLGPVLATASHPDVQPMGWARFKRLVQGVPFPVFALGGMEPAHQPAVIDHGGQGIAAIRSLWHAEDL